MITYQEILKRIAEGNNTTPEEVEQEMRLSIEDAFDTAKAENNTEVMKLQQQIPCAGERPTPEEFIYALAAMMRAEMEEEAESWNERYGEQILQ